MCAAGSEPGRLIGSERLMGGAAIYPQEVKERKQYGETYFSGG